MKTVHIILIFCIAVLIALAGCGNTESTKVRIAHNVWPGYVPLSLAKDLDFYQGIDVAIHHADSATDVIKAFKQGVVDVAAVTLDEVLLLQELDSSLLWVIAVLDISHGGDAIISTPNIKSFNDLKGKRVGVEANALGAYMISRALELSEGVGVEDLQVVPLTHEQHADAFLNGEVDAVVTFEPVRSRLLKNGGHLLFDSTQIPGEIVDVLIVNRQMANRTPEAVSQVVAGYFRALDYIEQQPQEANRLMGAYQGLSANDFLSTKEGIQIPDLRQNWQMLGTESPAILETGKRLQQIMLKNRVILKPSNTAELFTDKFLPQED